MDTNAIQKWLTLCEASEYMVVHESTARRAVKDGRLRAARVGGRKLLRFKVEWLDEFMLASSTPIEIAR